MTDAPEYFPMLLVCTDPLGQFGSLYNESTTFAIGEKFEQCIAIADTGVKAEIYQRRTIEIKDKVRELIFEVIKTDHLTRTATLIAKLANGRTECYIMFINLESPVDNI